MDQNLLSSFNIFFLYSPLPQRGRDEGKSGVTIQNRSVRHICFKHYRFHADPLFRELGLLKMPDICTLQMCEFMFKFNSSLLPVNFNNFFQVNSSVHHYDTRQVNDYHCFYARTRIRQTTVRFRGPIEWKKNYSKMSNCVEVCIYSGVKLNGHCCRHIINISLVCSLYIC